MWLRRGFVLTVAVVAAGILVVAVHVGWPAAAHAPLAFLVHRQWAGVLVLAAQALAAALALGRFSTTGNTAFLVLAAALGGSAATESVVRLASGLTDPNFLSEATVVLATEARRVGAFIQSFGLLLATTMMRQRIDRLRQRSPAAAVALATASLSVILLAYAALTQASVLTTNLVAWVNHGLDAASAAAITAAFVVHVARGGWRHRDSEFWLALALVFWVAEGVGVRPFIAGRDDGRIAFALIANGLGTVMVSIGLIIAVHHLFASAANTAERIRGVFESLADGILTIDQQGRIESINHAAEAMFQTEVKTALGKPFTDFIDGLDDSALSCVEPAENGRVLREFGHGRRADRSMFPAEIGISMFNIHGDERRAIVIRDISDQRAFEAMRRARNRELQDFIDAMSTLTAKLAKDGCLDACNQKAVEACGLPLSFLRGRPIWSAPFFKGHPRRAVRLRRAIRRAANGEAVDYEEIILIRGRIPIHARVAIRPIRSDDGEVKYLVVEASDVSRLVEAEVSLRQARDAALDAARVKSEFLAMMSHELRTPLNGVMGVASLLTETQLDEEQQEYVSLIEHSAKALLAIFNDILDYSKVEAGRLDIVEDDFDLVALIDGVVDLVAQQARDRDLDIGTLIPIDITTALRGDAGRLRQILLNLVSNAVKFTECGAISIEVRTEHESADRLTLRFDVIDTGIGIAPEAQARLFTRFSQIDTSSARRFGGTGLGLALSKKLVELMDGSIGVESEPGAGSCFWFSLPLRRGQPSATAAVGGDIVPDLAGRRVLIIDDHEIDQRIFRVQITRLGATVAVAASGAAGLEKIKQAMIEGAPFDLAIVDHHMPEMDGFEFGSRLAADPASSALPRIMVSSGHLRGDADRASGIGYRKFLTKPVHRRRLFETLNEVMPRGRASASCASGQPTEATAVSAATLSPVSAHRILIAEDNEVNQLLILAFLKVGGYQADVAVNGREAVDAVRTRPYALVLMDVNMPVMGGVVATQTIRALQAPARDVPIIAVTASNMAGDREHFLAIGMDDFLPKPIRRDSLLRMVEKWWPRSDDDQRQATA